MAEGAVLDLLGFYQRELRDSPDGRKALKNLGIEAPEVVDHFGLGWCSGRALKAASKEQHRLFKNLGLASTRRETLAGCLVVPVHDEDGELVDLHGIRSCGSQAGPDVRYLNWQSPPRGLIGLSAVKAGGDLILCENAFTALHVRQHGFANVAALRGHDEIGAVAARFERHGVVRVFLIAERSRRQWISTLEKAGLRVEHIAAPAGATIIPRDRLNVIDVTPSPAKPVEVRMTGRTDNRLVFQAGEMTYHIDSAAMAGLGMKGRVRIENGPRSFMDKIDLASAAGRRRFAQLAALRLGISGGDVENQLGAIAEAVDRMECDLAAAQNRAPKALSAEEERNAVELLQSPKLLDAMSGALDEELVGEGANKRLAILVAASRLLDKPLGAIVRGPAGCGKSALIQAVAKLLPTSRVLNCSRLTPQALFYMPRESMSHRLLVVDEYEGLTAAEYPLRTMMSSQSLSLAITLREGGRVPVTRTIEIPACLAVLVSATAPVNIENLSRFLELRMDDSAEQTQRVLEGLAARSHRPAATEGRTAIQDAMQVLRPCTVNVPFAERLVYKCGHVLARRRFAQALSLVSAHAALHQLQRARQERPDGTLAVTAEKGDYAAVHELLGYVVEHVEESLSPGAMALLRRLQIEKKETFTRREAMQWTGWCYSKTYRVLQELLALDLLAANAGANGILKTYTVAPYLPESGGIGSMPPPETI